MPVYSAVTMAKDADRRNGPNADDTGRSGRKLVHAIWIVGLLVPGAIGLAAKFVLDSRGVPTVSLVRGFELIFPLTLFTEIPFVILSLIARAILRRPSPMDRETRIGLNLVIGGALAGLVLAVGGYLLEPMLYAGPGGLAEVVGMMLALWPITLPFLFLWSAVGIIGGGIIGGILALIVTPLLVRTRDRAGRRDMRGDQPP